MSDRANTAALPSLSAPLEDYLETIFLLVQQKGYARVAEIARARDVSAPTVSIALRKLAELALVRHERREYVALTPAGEQAGRRVYARHQVLTRFFEEVLRMPRAAAGEQACALEHGLSDDAMDRLVRFFEFLGNCGRLPPDVLETFRTCQLDGAADAGQRCSDCAHAAPPPATQRREEAHRSLAEVQPGARARIRSIGGAGALRQRLLDMGLLPEADIEVERVGLGGDPLWIRCQGSQLALRRSEALSVLVHPA